MWPHISLCNTQYTAHVPHMPTLWRCTGGSVPHDRDWLITRRAAKIVRKAIGGLIVSTACSLVPWGNWRDWTWSRRTGRFDAAGICIIAIPWRVVDGTGTAWWASGREVTRYNDLIVIFIIHGIEVDEIRQMVECCPVSSLQISERGW